MILIVFQPGGRRQLLQADDLTVDTALHRAFGGEIRRCPDGIFLLRNVPKTLEEFDAMHPGHTLDG